MSFPVGKVPAEIGLDELERAAGQRIINQQSQGIQRVSLPRPILPDQSIDPPSEPEPCPRKVPEVSNAKFRNVHNDTFLCFPEARGPRRLII